MRDVRFRVWDGKKMLEPVAVENLLFSYGHNYDHISDGIVMQYTGLHDKNGTPVYEGDIVNYGTIMGSVEYATPSFSIDYCACGCVEELLGGFFVEKIKNIKGWYELEVIGNIYKNPIRINKGIHLDLEKGEARCQKCGKWYDTPDEILLHLPQLCEECKKTNQ